jgi:hypothetical protein
MAKHNVHTSIAEYEYGYDHQLQEYFLTKYDGEDGPIAIIGPLAGVYGDKVALIEAMISENIFHRIPDDHTNRIILDLPL